MTKKVKQTNDSKANKAVDTVDYFAAANPAHKYEKTNAKLEKLGEAAQAPKVKGMLDPTFAAKVITRSKNPITGTSVAATLAQIVESSPKKELTGAELVALAQQHDFRRTNPRAVKYAGAGVPCPAWIVGWIKGSAGNKYRLLDIK